MDNFSEQLVKKEPTSAERIKKTVFLIGGIILTALLAAVGIFLMGTGSLWPMLALILAAGMGYATFFFIQGTYVEYEYIFTNGELDIDKIVARKKRHNLISADIKTFTAFGKYNDELEETSDMTIVISSDNIASHEYYADFEHSEHGKVRLIFSPDTRTLENIKKFLPRSLRNSL